MPWEEHLLNDCEADYCGLWEVVAIAREQQPGISREQILSSLQRLLEKGLLMAGFPTENGFEPAVGTPQALVEKVRREWEDLGRDPTLGEILWFTTTPKGDRVVQRLRRAKPLPWD